MELLPTISLTKEFPVAQIRLNLQKSFPAESLTNNWMGTKSWGLGASGVRSKVWVLTIRVLEVNHEVDSIRAQRGRARSALCSRVFMNKDFL